MDARFDLLRPDWAVVALIALGALGAFLGARQGGAAARLGRAGLTALVALLSGWGLVAIGTPAAQCVLALLVVASAVALAWRYYTPARRDFLGRFPTATCRLCRAIALAGIAALLAQPVCNSTESMLQRPALAVLLDQSQSMSIRDGDDETAPTRADATNAAFARADLVGLERFHDITLMGLGEALVPIDDWRIEPSKPATAIAAALRSTAGGQSPSQSPLAAILLVADGAENTVAPGVVTQAARELQDQGIALVAVGVGPFADEVADLALEPLAVPSRVSFRDRLNIAVVARAVGMQGRVVRVDWLWDEEVFDSRTAKIIELSATLRETTRARPPRPGLVRLTARVSATDGPELAKVSKIIDVRDEEILVLIVARQPTSETAFVARALRGDPRLEPIVRLRPQPAAKAGALPLDGVDVVLLATAEFGAAQISALVEAVDRDGVGLLLAGGHEMFNDGDVNRSALTLVSPVEFVIRPRYPAPIRFQPTLAARDHPAMQGLADAGSTIWAQLPEILGGIRWGSTKPLATVLARDALDRPILVAQEFGRGRCMAAGWDATWPWALGSDDGLRLHRAFWRQLVVWLANRRPVAWVLADEPSYSLDAVRSGARVITIRAGVAGVAAGSVERKWTAKLELRRLGGTDSATKQTAASRPRASARPVETQPPTTDGPWPLTVRRRGDDAWVAELPEALASRSWLTPGDFELVFTATGAGADAGDSMELEGRSGFTIEQLNPEFAAPTANIGLLKRAAEETRASGGRYVSIDRLPDLIADLAEQDKRIRVQRETQRAPVKDQPWRVWSVIIAALAIEWGVRKRNNLL